MDENVILQLFIAFKDELVPDDKRSPQEICEAYKQFKEVAKQVFMEEKNNSSSKKFRPQRGPKNYSDTITENF
ncbi:hypothetical protein [Desulfurobacterium sp.]